jgi:hypothetical protein
VTGGEAGDDVQPIAVMIEHTIAIVADTLIIKTVLTRENEGQASRPSRAILTIRTSSKVSTRSKSPAGGA